MLDGAIVVVGGAVAAQTYDFLGILIQIWRGNTIHSCLNYLYATTKRCICGCLCAVSASYTVHHSLELLTHTQMQMVNHIEYVSLIGIISNGHNHKPI